jgi:hypothetical protein
MVGTRTSPIKPGPSRYLSQPRLPAHQQKASSTRRRLFSLPKIQLRLELALVLSFDFSVLAVSAIAFN